MPIYLPIAEISVDLPVLIGMGLSVGLLSGLFGVGGGFIMTPLLIFLGIPPGVAVATGASQLVAASVSGVRAHWSRGTVDLKMGLFLIAGGLFGATTGVSIQGLLQAAGQLELFVSLTYVVMLGVIGTMMLIEGLRSLRSAKIPGRASARRGGQHSWILRLPFKQRFRSSKIYISIIPPCAIGALAGWLTAIMGIGGGFLLVPALIYLLNLPTRIALGTSAIQILFVAAFTTVLQAVQNDTVDLMLGLPLMAGGVIGAQIGVRLSQRLAAEQLRVLLAILVLAVAVRMTVDLALPPADLYSLGPAPD
jgi:uncharacterized membrane protein YfcA